jgi:transcriptional regulator GlxA family with amidase domain
VAVVVGQTGSVVTDVLAPYEVFARSTRFHVYTVSEHRSPVVLTGGLPVLPDHTYRDVDSGAVRQPDVVVVPAVAEPTGDREAPMRSWVARQAARGARILGVCSGSHVLATAGVLDGRRATSFWMRLGSLRDDYPGVA